MPDISKLSGTLIDSVGKVDGVPKEDIASIVGLTVPSGTAYTPPLDTYTGATAAYSVRKLRTAYSGGCIEAYRVSDGATQDIGFDGDGLIDTAAIVTFASGGEVRVRTWYDQSGNASDAVQTTASRMPQVYDGASVITEDGQPALKAQDDWFVAGGGAVTGSGMLASVSRHTGLSFQTTLVWDQRVYYTGNGGISMRGNSGTISGTVSGTTSQNLITAKFDDTNAVGRFNGSQFATGATGTTATISAIFSRVAGLETSPNAVFQEMVWWSSWDTSDTLGLEVNINDYYQIANLPASSSGLLYDYPDAAAAYSVRSLSNNAIKCMRVRRTVSPFDEQDIGFDSNGDLDTAAIAAFGGSDPLTVSAWYDQSGQSRHATQVTAANQAQIYNGASVIMENGKPALDFAGVGVYPVGNVVTDDVTIVGVVKTSSSNTVQAIMSVQEFYNQGYELIYINPNSMRWAVTTADLDITFPSATQSLLFASYDGSSQELALDGTNTTNSTTQSLSLTYDLSIGTRRAGLIQQPWAGVMQEIVVYANDTYANTTDRNGIESNINTYYSIY